MCGVYVLICPIQTFRADGRSLFFAYDFQLEKQNKKQGK